MENSHQSGEPTSGESRNDSVGGAEGEVESTLTRLTDIQSDGNDVHAEEQSHTLQRWRTRRQSDFSESMSDDDDDLDGDDDDGNGDVVALKTALNNEINSPELLPYAAAARRLSGRAHQHRLQQEQSRAFGAKLAIPNYDIRRVTYVLTQYTRVRSEKIEEHFTYYLHDNRARQDLTRSELEFAERCAEIVDEYGNQYTHMLPSSTNTKGLVVKPLLDVPVFCQALEDVDDVPVDDDEVVNMKAGSKHALAYTAIRDIVRQGKAVLV